MPESFTKPQMVVVCALNIPSPESKAGLSLLGLGMFGRGRSSGRHHLLAAPSNIRGSSRLGIEQIAASIEAVKRVIRSDVAMCMASAERIHDGQVH
jgi:hypothetical protein